MQECRLHKKRNGEAQCWQFIEMLVRKGQVRWLCRTWRISNTSTTTIYPNILREEKLKRVTHLSPAGLLNLHSQTSTNERCKTSLLFWKEATSRRIFKFGICIRTKNYPLSTALHFRPEQKTVHRKEVTELGEWENVGLLLLIFIKSTMWSFWSLSEWLSSTQAVFNRTILVTGKQPTLKFNYKLNPTYSQKTTSTVQLLTNSIIFALHIFKVCKPKLPGLRCISVINLMNGIGNTLKNLLLGKSNVNSRRWLAS